MLDFDDSWTEDLTAKQQEAVVLHVENGCNISKTAALVSGYSFQSIQKFFRSAKGRLALKKYIEGIIGLNKDTLELRIIDIYMLQAFYDPSDIIDANGRLVVDDLKELGDLSKCIEGIETTYTRTGVPIIKVKLVDRQKALEQLARYINIMTDSLQVSGKDGGAIEVWQMTRSERKKKIKEFLKKKKNK
jgi:hypothetical protein